MGKLLNQLEYSRLWLLLQRESNCCVNTKRREFPSARRRLSEGGGLPVGRWRMKWGEGEWGGRLEARLASTHPAPPQSLPCWLLLRLRGLVLNGVRGTEQPDSCGNCNPPIVGTCWHLEQGLCSVSIHCPTQWPWGEFKVRSPRRAFATTHLCRADIRRGVPTRMGLRWEQARKDISPLDTYPADSGKGIIDQSEEGSCSESCLEAENDFLSSIRFKSRPVWDKTLRTWVCFFSTLLPPQGLCICWLFFLDYPFTEHTPSLLHPLQELSHLLPFQSGFPDFPAKNCSTFPYWYFLFLTLFFSIAIIDTWHATYFIYLFC